MVLLSVCLINDIDHSQDICFPIYFLFWARRNRIHLYTLRVRGFSSFFNKTSCWIGVFITCLFCCSSGVLKVSCLH
jgi:hypothetical protein